MSTKVRKHTAEKKVIRFKRKKRIRDRVLGTPFKPRLAIFKSNTNIYVQLIDDLSGATLVAASTIEKEARGKLKNTREGARALGTLVAKRALEKKIDHVVFDRSGYLFHGKIKTLADAAREAGLKF